MIFKDLRNIVTSDSYLDNLSCSCPRNAIKNSFKRKWFLLQQMNIYEFEKDIVTEILQERHYTPNTKCMAVIALKMNKLEQLRRKKERETSIYDPNILIIDNPPINSQPRDAYVALQFLRYYPNGKIRFKGKNYVVETEIEFSVSEDGEELLKLLEGINDKIKEEDLLRYMVCGEELPKTPIDLAINRLKSTYPTLPKVKYI